MTLRALVARNLPFTADALGSTPAKGCDYTFAPNAAAPRPLDLRINGQHAVSVDVAPVREIVG
jgi:hypothetical protein